MPCQKPQISTVQTALKSLFCQPGANNPLRIWQDTNQDGVSPATELRTLTEVGVASISTVATATTINLGNGNTQPFSSSFTRTNGTAGTSGTAELSGSLLLASNNFYREFTDDPVVTVASSLDSINTAERFTAAHDVYSYFVQAAYK